MRQVIQKIKRLFIQEMKFWTVQIIGAEVITVLLLLFLKWAGIGVASFSETVWAFVIFDFAMVVFNLVACTIVTIIGNKER